ncbi:MAG: hypothetical protein Q8P67_06490, partial [archaeon]|nr:hypothetical protein [archaeon]
MANSLVAGGIGAVAAVALQHSELGRSLRETAISVPGLGDALALLPPNSLLFAVLAIPALWLLHQAFLVLFKPLDIFR